MFLLFENCILLSLGCGIMAAVYRGILAYEPILNWWFRFGNRYENRWFFAPLWGCLPCIAGQLALWFFILLAIFEGKVEISRPVSAIFGLLLTICGAILTAIILHPIISKIKNG